MKKIVKHKKFMKRVRKWRNNQRSKLILFKNVRVRRLLEVKLAARYRLKKLRRKVTLNKTVLTVAVLISVGLFVFNTGWFEGVSPPEDPNQFFFNAGTMIGAMLAIVFAFSTQLAARTAESLPTRFFHMLSRDKILDTYFTLIGLQTFTLFAFGLVITDQNNNVRLVLFRIGGIIIVWSVAFLYFSYRRLLKLMSYDYLILRLSKKFNDEVDEMIGDASKVMESKSYGYGLSEEEKRALVTTYLGQMKSRTDQVITNLEGLVELYKTYKAKDDFYPAYTSLYACFSLIMGYVNKRKDTAILYPNPDYPINPESAVGDFVQTSLELLKPVWTEALANNDVPVIRKYLEGMQGVVRSTLFIEHIGNDSSNPAYQKSYYQFRELANEAIEAKNVDAVFHTAQVFNQVADLAITKRYTPDLLETLLEDMAKIMQQCLLEKKLETAHYMLSKNYLMILERIFAEDEVSDFRIRQLIETVPNTIAATALISTNIMTQTIVATYADRLLPVATQKMGDKPKLEDYDKFIKVSKLIVAIVQKLTSVSSGRNHDTQAYNRPMTSVAHDIVKMLSNEKLSADIRSELEYIWRDIVGLMGHVPDLNKLKSSSDLEDLIDRMIQIALFAISYGDQDKASELFDVIIGKLEQLLGSTSKDLKAYDAVIYVNRTKVIGALARKKSFRKLQAHVAQRIRDFEKLYHKTFFPSGIDPNKNYVPSPKSLRQDYSAIYYGNPRSGLPDYFADSNATFYKEANTDDLDGFEEYLWR